MELQQADMAERNQPARPPISGEQRELERKRQGLQLSRTRLLQQLEASRNPRHRQMLTDSLAELDRQLSSLE